MRIAAPLTVAAAALTLLAGAQARSGPVLASEDQGDVSTQAASTFVVSTFFRGLTPGVHLDPTWTAHFEDSGTYTLGGSWGLTPGAAGTLNVFTDVADLTPYNQGAGVDYVRVCLRPPRTPAATEIVGSDGHAVCANVDLGGYGETYPG